MNPISEEQWRQWLDFTQRDAELYPYSYAIETLTNYRDMGNFEDRRSLETFIAGWQAGYWTDRAT